MKTTAFTPLEKTSDFRERSSLTGFTIIELIMSMALLSILSWIGIAVMFSGIDTWGFFTQRKELLSDGRLAMDRMLCEIRMVKDTASVITANSTSFGFTDANNDTIAFSLNSAALARAANGAPNTLLDNVMALGFTYYDSSGAVIASPIVAPSATDIRRARISISMSKGASRTVNLRSDVWPRNLK